MNNQYCVYKHTSPSGKSYIGQTKNLYKRNIEHKSNRTKCSAFALAIKKYGWDNFTHEILIENISVDEANDWEKFYIFIHNTLAPHGYNLTTGGLNKTISLATREKMRQSTLNSTYFEQRRINRIESNKNRVWTKEQRELSRIRKTGLTASIETKQKMSMTRKGKPHSETHRQNLAIANQKRAIANNLKKHENQISLFEFIV